MMKAHPWPVFVVESDISSDVEETPNPLRWFRKDEAYVNLAGR
jgi:hypothetical protein